MADKIISEVGVQGGPEAEKEFDNLAKAGVSAFDKIAAAAERASSSIAKASRNISSSIANAFTTKDPEKAAAALTKFQGAARDAAGVMVLAASKGAAFATNMALVGGAVVTGIAGIARFASSVTAAARANNTLKNEQLAVIEVQKTADIQARTSALAHENALAALHRQFGNGKIGVEEYSNAIDELNFKRQQEIATQRAVAAIQETEAKEAARARSALEQRVALTELQNRFGGVLAGSLLRLANLTEQLRVRFVNTFGPTVAALVDRVTEFLMKNGDQIIAFFQGILNSITAVFSGQNGDGVKIFFDGIMAGAKAVADAFTSVIIPAVSGLLRVFDAIANVVNGIFGTQISGQALLVATAIAGVTGALSALLTVIGAVILGVRALALAMALLAANPVGLAIAAIVVAIGLLVLALSQVDWGSFLATAKAAIDAVVGFFSGLVTSVVTFFTDMWAKTKELWNSGLNFLRTTWDGWVKFFNDQIDEMIGGIKAAIDWLRKLFAAAGQSTGSAGNGTAGAQSNAQGGAISGPGTGTSDSILSWLSNGEYVVKAKAARWYGTNFLNAINSRSFNPSNLFARFADGGGFGAIPDLGGFGGTGALEAAASEGAQRVLNLTIGDETFRGLRVPSSEADRLERFAIAKQIRSTGRMPAWVT